MNSLPEVPRVIIKCFYRPSGMVPSAIPLKPDKPPYPGQPIPEHYVHDPDFDLPTFLKLLEENEFTPVHGTTNQIPCSSGFKYRSRFTLIPEKMMWRSRLPGLPDAFRELIESQPWRAEVWDDKEGNCIRLRCNLPE